MQKLLEAIGLPDTPENKIYVGAALKWLAKHTTCEVDSTEELAPDVQLFILKYSQLMANHAGVTSESISGMSQSFVTGQKLDDEIYKLASAILGSDVLKSTVTVFSGESRWDYGC